VLVAERQPCADEEATAVLRPGLEIAAIQRHALAHADEPVTAADAVPGAPTVSVIDDLELERLAPVADAHVRRRRTGVPERVRQCLLHDAIGGEINPTRERPLRALDLQLDHEPGAAHGCGTSGP